MAFDLNQGIDALGVLETGWGRNKTVGQNNFWNIKDFSGKGTKAFDKVEGSTSAYLDFATPEEGRAHLLSLLERKYPNAFNAQTKEEFVNGLKGYATDPEHGNKILAILNRMESGNVPSQSRTQPVQQQSIDFSKFPQYSQKIAEAKQNGFSDQEILWNIQQDEKEKAQTSRAAQLSAQIEAQKTDATNGVRTRLARDGDLFGGIAYLSTLPGYREEIQYAKSIGKTDKEILENLVPGSMDGYTAFQNRNSKNFIENAGAGAIDAINGMILGGRQIINFDPEENRRLRAEEEARRNDPNRIALNQTVGGIVGQAIPDTVIGVAGAFVPGALPVRIGAAAASGAISGGLIPVAGDESRTQNVLTNAAIGAAGQGIAEGLLAGGSKVADKVNNIFKGRTQSVVDETGARAVSNTIADKLRIPLGERGVIDEEYIKLADEALSKEYDNFLDNKFFQFNEQFMKDYLDNPDFRRRAPADLLRRFDEVRFNYNIPDGFDVKYVQGKPQLIRLVDTAKIPKDFEFFTPRTDITLREAHNLYKDVKGDMFKTSNQQVIDNSKLEVLREFRDAYENAFFDGVSHNNVKTVADFLEPIIPGNLSDTFDKVRAAYKRVDEYNNQIKMGRDDAKKQLEDLDRRFGMFKVAEEVFKRTKADGKQLSDVDLWNSALSSSPYVKRFVRGDAPLQDVQQALRVNIEENKQIAQTMQNIKDTQRAISAGLFFGGANKLGGMLAYGSSLYSPVLKRMASIGKNPYAGLDTLVGGQEQLDAIKKAVIDGLPVNADRRLTNLPVAEERRKKRPLERALNAQKLRVAVPIVSPIVGDE